MPRVSVNGYSDYKTIHLTKSDDQILEVRLHRDEGPLTFGMDAHLEWVELWKEIADDPEVRLVIVTGTGEAFTPRRTNQAGGERPPLPIYWQRIMRESTDHVMKFLEIPVPVITALNGPTHTHGEFAFLADMVIATPDTNFRDISHFPDQVIPTDGQHAMLSAIIGRQRANYFFYADQTVSAEDAKQLGLVNEIVPRDRLMERAYQIARWMIRQPPVNLRYFRRVSTHELRRKMLDIVELGLAYEGLAMMAVDFSDWKSDYGGLPPLDA